MAKRVPDGSAMTLTRRGFTVTLSACGAALALAPGALARAADVPPLGRYRYTVLRQGRPIGTHVRTLRRDGDVLVVASAVDLSVDLLGIPVYSYRHRSVERWRGATLLELTSRTDKNGTAKRLNGRRDGDGVLVLENHKDERRAFRDSPLTTSLWHPATPRARELLEVEDGWMKTNAARQIGRESVPVGAGSRAARHYRLGGEVERDVWYDARGLLLRVAFQHDDGSRIVMQPAADFA